MPASKKQLLDLLKKAEKAYQDFESAIFRFNEEAVRIQKKISQQKDLEKLKKIRESIY